MKTDLNLHSRHKKVGLLGGGQLAMMISESLTRSGLEPIIYAQSIIEPACSVATHVLIGASDDHDKLRTFFGFCDIVVLESEFYSPQLLKFLIAETKTQVLPDIKDYTELYSKSAQKNFFTGININATPYHEIQSANDLSSLPFDGPYIAKHSHGGYDGYGNKEYETAFDLKNDIKDFSKNFSKKIILEKKLNLKQEYACLLIKNSSEFIIFDPCRTYQQNHCCQLVEMTPDIDATISSKIRSMVEKIASNLHGKGVYAFEFFETTDEKIYINEAAPRVHNSYHFTTEAYDKDQFDYITELVLDNHITMPIKKYKYLSMINLLGQEISCSYNLNFPFIEGSYEYKIHLYGKKESRLGRKLGHVTLFGNETNIEIAKQINNEYTL